jgi:hypothetical protein
VVDIITADDLPQSVRDRTDAAVLATMVAGANARASRVAPCLAATEPPATADQIAEAKLVLIGAVQRWADAGGGAFQQQTAGPFSVAYDTRQRSGFNLWPSEIEDLQAICAGDTATRKAFMIDQTTPTYSGDETVVIDGQVVNLADRPDLWMQYG